MFQLFRHLVCSFLMLSALAEGATKFGSPNKRHELYYEKQLAPVICSMMKHPEVRQLVKRALADGSIKVEVANRHNTGFGALWDCTDRLISVNGQQTHSKGALICSIIFELHNAATNTQLKALAKLAIRGQISKDQYVEGVERIEHYNALSTVSILNKGIQMGIFPQNCRWDIRPNFDEHYQIQQLTNHSQWIARNYDSLTKSKSPTQFRGTIPNLNRLSQSEKNDMLRYLTTNNAQDRRDLPKVLKSRAEMADGSVNGHLDQQREVMICFGKVVSAASQL